MTATKPPPKTVRQRSQPLRLWCVEYVFSKSVYVTTVEAATSALARDKFDWEHPNVKVVRVY